MATPTEGGRDCASADTSWAMRALQLISAGTVLAALGWIGTGSAAAGCDENLHPGTTRTDVCRTLDLGGPKTVLYLFGPLLLFAALLITIPVARRHIMVTAAAVAALSIVGYATVLALVV